MRSLSVALASTALLGVHALTLAEPRSTAPRVVEHTIQRRHVLDPVGRDRARLRKRQSGTINVALDNEETLYFMNVSIGTPAQNLRMHIDTGSSDLWVNTPSSQLCQSQGEPCAVSGTYSANSSSTYHYVNSLFNISYVDGSGSAGDYATDTVAFGGVTINNQELGIGYTSSSQQGILGIGYSSNEALVQVTRGRSYSNVPQSLASQGSIQSNAYSLWLNDLDASTGSILFGGVNTAKYMGTLQTLPIVPTIGNNYLEFIIALTGVGMNGKNGSITNNTPIPALLDSGSSLIYLPDRIAESIYKTVGVTFDETQGAALIDCNRANDNTMSVDFTFSGPTISVSLNELVLVAAIDRGQPICILGIAPTGGSTPVLGDTFLRSAYVVYDLHNNQISLAQTDFNSTTDNILEITPSGVPDATTVSNAVNDVQGMSSDGARINGNVHVTSSSAAEPTRAPAYNLAMLGAAGAGLLYVL